MHVYAQNLEIIETARTPFRPSHGQRWIILGSSPGAGDTYRRVRSELATAIVATCNNGIKDEPSPHVYWLTDPTAVKLHFDDAVRAKAGGSRIASSVASLRLVPQFAPLIDDLYLYPTTWLKEWAPGHLCNGRTSGCFLVQLAAIHKASEIHLVGMAGYKSSPNRIVVDYDDGRAGLDMHAMTMSYYGPMLQSVMDQCPDTQFIFHGRPNYPWAGKNVQIVKTREPGME